MTETLESLLERIQTKYTVAFEPLDVDGSPLQVLTISDMRGLLDTMLRKNAIKNPLKDLPLWAKVWPGSFILGRLLRKYEPQGKTLLELGGGCGIVSLIAARYGFSSVLTTDINEDALLFARANILKNHMEDIVSVQHLDVQAPQPTHAHLPTYDIIAASELLYLDELHRPALKFLHNHLKDTGIAFFCTDRARQKPHFAKLAKKSFFVEEGHIGLKIQEDGKEERRIYDIFMLRKEKASSPQ